MVHFSVQRDHLHLLVEADDRRALGRGMQGLAIRVAKAVNHRLGRHGKVFGDRYYARALRTPRETRLALRYVLSNLRKHGHGARSVAGRLHRRLLLGIVVRRLEPSARALLRRRGKVQHGDLPVMPPRTWLLSAGWRRAGPMLDPDEHPASD